MAISKTWDATVPASTRDLGLGDDDIRGFKEAIAERLQRAHVWELTDGTTDANAGRLACGADQFFLTAANDGILAVYDITGATSEFEVHDGNSGTPDIIDCKGKDLTDVGTLAGTRRHTVAIPLPFAATGRVAGVYLYNDTGASITLVSVDGYCDTAPTGADLQVDIHLVAASGSRFPADLSTGGTTILSSVLVIAAGVKQVTSGPVTPSTTTWAVNETLVFDIDQVGSTVIGANLILFLTVDKVA